MRVMALKMTTIIDNKACNPVGCYLIAKNIAYDTLHRANALYWRS